MMRKTKEKMQTNSIKRDNMKRETVDSNTASHKVKALRSRKTRENRNKS